MKSNISKINIFSTSVLKIIACLTMLIDHIGAYIFEDIIWLRIIGRLAFPLFAFSIAVGWRFTRSKKKYIMRLIILAVASSFVTFFLNSDLNILFTFILALLTIEGIEYLRKLKLFNGELSFIKYVLIVLVVVITCTMSELLSCDYGFYGILITLGFYYLYKYKFLLSLCFLLINAIYVIYKINFERNDISSLLQFGSVFSLLFICLYNYKRGANLKYAFYTFYPLHLLILLIIKLSI